MKALKIFKKLVQIDSPSGEESGMVKFLEDWFGQRGIKVTKDKLGNLYIKIDGAGESMLLSAHMDTVEPGRGITPLVKDGFVQSQGDTILGADNKSSLSAILAAVERHLKSENPRTLELLFTVKEESGGGVEFFDSKLIQSKIGFIFDFAKPLGGIVLASPHIINFNAKITGKAGHASEPSKAINSLQVFLEVMKNIKLGQVSKFTTVNIGELKSGTGVNTIPGETSLIGEIRSYKNEEFKEYLELIKSEFKKSCKKYKAKLDFTTDGYSPGYFHSKKQEIFKDLETILKNNRLTPIYFEKSAVSDANILNNWGIQTINLSDGVIDPHTVNERIAVKDLEKIENIISNIIETILV